MDFLHHYLKTYKLKALRKIKGLENVKMFRAGYFNRIRLLSANTIKTHFRNKNNRKSIFFRTNKRDYRI